MNLIINIYYTGENGSARKFINEMISSGIVDKIRKEEGNSKSKSFLYGILSGIVEPIFGGFTIILTS